MSGGNGGGNRGGFVPPMQYNGGPNMQAGGPGGMMRSPQTGGLEPMYGGNQQMATDTSYTTPADYDPAAAYAAAMKNTAAAGGGTRYPPVPSGIPAGMWTQAQDRLMAQQQPTVGSTEWAQSPQGLAAFGDVTSRARMMGNPIAAGAMGMMRGQMGNEAANAAARGTAYQQAEAAKMNRGPADFAGPPAYMGGGFTYDPAAGQAVGPAGYKGAPWYDPNRTGQTMAQYIHGLPQAERDELLAKYQAAGMPNPLGGTAGTPGNPFGV